MEWIDIKDQIPLFHERVLAYASGRIYIAFRAKESEYNEHWTICEDQDCSCVGCTGAITHWMPLPEAPK